MTEVSADCILISAKIMKPVLAEVDAFAGKHGLSRNKMLNLLLAVGLSHLKELYEKVSEGKDAYVR
jgi:hypothetical protein